MHRGQQTYEELRLSGCQALMRVKPREQRVDARARDQQVHLQQVSLEARQASPVLGKQPFGELRDR
jgi:hypothetical protein